MPRFFRKPLVDPALQRLRTHAQQLILSRRQDVAEGVLRQILGIVPNDSQAHRQLAGCLLKLRRIEEAHEHAQKSLAANAASEANHVILGAVLSVKRCHDEAVAAYQRALQLKPSYPPALFGLADTFAVKAKWSDAIAWANRGLAIKPDHVGMLRTRGESLAALGREEEALATMEQFLRLKPDASESHRVASAIYKRLGRTEEATVFATRAMQLDPANPHLHNSVAQLKLKEKQFSDADRHFKEAAEIYESRREGQKGSKVIEVQSLLGQAAINLKKRRFKLAEAQYRRVQELAPEHKLVRSLLAGTLGIQHRHEEALMLGREAVEREPGLITPRMILAAILTEMERHDEAREIVDRGLEIKPDSAGMLRVLATIHIDLEEYAKALDYAEKAYSAEPSVAAQRLLAAAFAGLGRTDEAIEATEASLRTEPDQFSSEAAAGYVFYRLGQYQRAESHLLRAIALDESGLGGHGWLGLVYVAQGRAAEARPLLERALSLNPNQRRIRAALERISAEPDRQKSTGD